MSNETPRLAHPAGGIRPSGRSILVVLVLLLLAGGGALIGRSLWSELSEKAALQDKETDQRLARLEQSQEQSRAEKARLEEQLAVATRDAEVVRKQLEDEQIGSTQDKGRLERQLREALARVAALQADLVKTKDALAEAEATISNIEGERGGLEDALVAELGKNERLRASREAARKAANETAYTGLKEGAKVKACGGKLFFDGCGEKVEKAFTLFASPKIEQCDADGGFLETQLERELIPGGIELPNGWYAALHCGAVG